MIIIKDRDAEKDRTEAFAQMARERRDGRIIALPTMLSKEERRLYVRETMREDHQFRIQNHPEGAQAKFDKLADSPFKFFRGTALLFYRDYAGMDLHLPIVFTIGDVHPENFGVMPNEDGAPLFGIDDYDEATFAPFSYDVKRGGTGFYITAKQNGLSNKKRRKVVRAFVRGYLDGLSEFAADDREKWHEYRIDNSPKMIRKLLEKAQKSQLDFLEDMIDVGKERFVSSSEIVPHSKEIEKFQSVIDEYREANDLPEKEESFFRVVDVAVKKDSGTASLGLDRFFVMLNGRSDDPSDNIILEMKQSRRSALRGLVPDVGNEEDGNAAGAIVQAHSVHLAGGDPFYGQATIDDKSFLVRERSPFKDDIDVDDLDYKGLRRYATICGKVLAQTHARSDEDTGIMEGDAEKRILSAVDLDLFVDDCVRFAEAAAKRIYKDYKLFKKDHKLGAFDFVNSES